MDSSYHETREMDLLRCGYGFGVDGLDRLVWMCLVVVRIFDLGNSND